MNEKIDAVIAWVDGNDPDWIKKKKHALNRGVDYKTPNEGDLPKRYIECDEIFYCIKLIRKNANWINTIYLITDNQRPKWLSQDVCKKLGVCIVDHEDIFTEHLHALPTFNSRSIETEIINIPNLSEKFIYFNDDMFLVKEVTPEDFFNGNDLVVRGRIGMKNLFLDKALRLCKRPFFSDGYIGRRPGVKKLPGNIFYIDMAHTPHALFKTDFIKIFDKKMISHNVSYRVRGTDQISPIGFVANCSKFFRKVIRKNNDWACLYSSDIHNMVNLDKFIQKRNEVKFLCLNDLPDVEYSDLKKVHGKLDRILYWQEP